MKIINSRVHAMIDYALDVVLILAPTVFGFSTVPSTICYVVAGGHFLMNICTQYEISVMPVIPFSVHGAIEFAAAIALALMPWLGRFSTEDVARNFFVLTGTALFTVWLLTNYKSTSSVRILDKDKDDTLPFRRAS